jgi:hypothetical protein
MTLQNASLVAGWIFMMELPALLAFAGFLVIYAARPGDPNGFYLDAVFGSVAFLVWALAQVFRREYCRDRAPQKSPRLGPPLSIMGGMMVLLLIMYIALLIDTAVGQQLQVFVVGVPGGYLMVSYLPLLAFALIAGEAL